MPRDATGTGPAMAALPPLEVVRTAPAPLAGSVVLMSLPAVAKQRVADRLGSPATRGEGRQNLPCAYLAGALLAGLLGNAPAGAWWLDPGVGALIAGLAVREGLDAWRGQGCCVLDDALGGAAGRGCTDDCCG